MAALLFSAGVLGLGSLSGSVVQAKGLMWMGLGINTIWGLLMIGGFYFVLAPWGATGLALDYAIAYGLMMVLVLVPLSLLGVYPMRLSVRTLVGCFTLVPLCAGPILIPSHLRVMGVPVIVILVAVLAWRLYHDKGQDPSSQECAK